MNRCIYYQITTLLSRGQEAAFLDPGTRAALGCEFYAFLSNSFSTVLLQSVSKITLTSCCQIPPRGCPSGVRLVRFQPLRSGHTLSWGRRSVPGTSVFPQILRELIVRKGKTICILFSVKNYPIKCRFCECPVSFIYILAFSLMIKYFKTTNKFVS